MMKAMSRSRPSARPNARPIPRPIPRPFTPKMPMVPSGPGLIELFKNMTRGRAMPIEGGIGGRAQPPSDLMRAYGNMKKQEAGESGTGPQLAMKKGGAVKSSASKRADGVATKGKTKGRMV